jgi:hypothetical protein
MKNIIRIAGLGLFAATIILYACQKDVAGSGNGNAANLNKLEVKLEDDTLPNGGWISLNIHPGIYNILRFRNGLDTLFATGTLPNGRVQKIRLTLGTQNSVMKNGQSFPLRVKDEDREVIADLPAGSFEIVPPNQVLFWIDFDASHSIQIDNSGPGNGNGYRLKSHIKIFTTSNSGEIEGKVLPRAADPLVMAIKGTDTTMAVPDHDDGEFKIRGLIAGTYRVFIDGRNNYNDTTINNVIVRNNEDTHLPTITLHQ